LHDLLGTGCQSLEWFRGGDEEEVEGGSCVICKVALEPSGYKKKWVEHDGVKACVGHIGVRAWNRSFRGHNGDGKGQDDDDVGGAG
jgi:hypothetical protein